MNTYTAGEVIEFTCAFVDETGAPVDPTTVTFKYAVTDTKGVATSHSGSYTYTGSSTPAPGTVARTGVGTYEAQVDTTGQDGGWIYEFISTGSGQSVASGAVRVVPAPI